MSADAPHSTRGLPDRIYARFGWKSWPILTASCWLFGTFLGVTTCVDLFRIQPTPIDVAVGLCLLIFTVTVTAGAFATLYTVHACAPLRRPLDTEASLLAAWHTAVSLPIRIVRANLAIVVVAAPVAPTMSPDELDAALDQFADGLKETLAELRDLARGLHPAILTTDGLAPALQQLATRAKVPVSVTAPPERFPEQVETTAYFVAAEALVNVAKYARASCATVTAAQDDGHLTIEVADNGIGGASATSGSGLSGLVDRVAAIGGRLKVESEAGKGTRVVAELPLDGSPHG